MISTIELRQDIAEYVRDSIDKALVTVGGQEIEVTADATRESTLIKVRVYMGENIDGLVEQIKVMSGERVYIVDDRPFNKPGDRGFYKLYKFNVSEIKEV